MSPPLVLLHGFTGGPSSFDALLSHLPPDGRTFRPALLGHADAGCASERWDDEIDRLAREIRARVGEGAHLFGYSLGARVGLSLLAAHPGLFGRATLNGARLPPAAVAEREARAARDAAWASRLETEPLESFVAAWENQPLFETQRELPLASRQARRRERLGHDPHGLSASLHVLGLAAMPDLRPRLAEVRVPLTLAVGALDPAFRAHAEEILAYLPHARLVVFEGAGHDLTLERPAELVALLLQMDDR